MSNDVTIDLLANPDQLKAGFADALKTVDEFADKVEDTGDEMSENLGQNTEESLGVMDIAIGVFLGNLATKVFDGVVAAFSKAFGAAKDLVKDSLEAFSVQEDAVANLEAVLKATGNAAGFTSEQMQQLASDMQATTRFGDETALQAQAVIATFKNIRGDQFKEVLELSADVATIMGGDLRSNALRLARAIDDPVQGMMALTRVGITFNEQQKETIQNLVDSGQQAEAAAIIMDELKSKVGGAAQETGETGTAMAQLSNRFGDIIETVGEALIPAFEALMPVFDDVMTALENSIPMLETFIKWIVDVAKSITGPLINAFEFMVDIGIQAFAAVETVFENFGLTAQTVFVGFTLGIVKAFETLKFWLLDVIPGLLNWFRKNFVGVFIDINMFLSKAIGNMIKNVTSFFRSLKRLLSGRSADFRFTALTEGFEITFTELPKIAKRRMGPLEAELQESFDKLSAQVGSAFEKNLDKRRKQFADFTDDLSKKREEAAVDMTPTVVEEATKELSSQTEVFTDIGKRIGKAIFGGTADEKIQVEAEVEESPKQKAEKKEENQARIEDLLSMSRRIESATSPEVEAVEKQTEKVEEQTGVLTKIQETASGVLDNVKEFATTQAGAAAEFIKQAPSSVAETAQNLMNFRERLNKGVTDRLDMVVENTGGTLKTIRKSMGLQ